MNVYRKCFRYGFFCGTLLVGVSFCLYFKNFLESRTIQRVTSGSLPLRVNDSSFDCRSDPTQGCGYDDDQFWRAEYESRLQRVQDTCNEDENFIMRRFWRSLTNRLNGQNTQCRTKLCPIIVDEQKILFCSIPKVASCQIKKFFLNISNININDTLKNNCTVMNVAADDALRRISPMDYTFTTFNHFYKIVFVCHPFDRLVSAFRSKAERLRDEVPDFYNKYWDPIMKKLRPRGSTLDQITFKEFVWYLMYTDKREYDEHWAPFWSRCNPCLVNYDFIGKLETAKQDFLHAFREARIEFNPEWWTEIQPTHRAVTLKYFATLPEDMIRSLYEIYKLDFELFGYSVHDFLPGNIAVR